MRNNIEYRDENGWTERQIQVVRLIDRGLSYKEIGVELNISPDTVKSHLRNLAVEHGLRGRFAAVYEARRLGYLIAHEPNSEMISNYAIRRSKQLEEGAEKLEVEVTQLGVYLKWLATRGTVPETLANWPAKMAAIINGMREKN